jgi:tRNA(Ile)-lysidine synthase
MDGDQKVVDVLAVVRNEIEYGQLLEPGTAIVVGVSGGSDSLCLLHLLRRLRSEYNWSLHVAHLNHCLRGTQSDDDMIFVALLAMEWGLSCTVQAVDVAAVAQQRRSSLEETGRQVRYTFLSDVARRVGARAVAVGHHADDQSETVLMHFLRGAGLAGLRGMSPAVNLDTLGIVDDAPTRSTPPSHIQLVRPLLSVPRSDIERYCRAHGLSPRQDWSNQDTVHFRNRLRHELLPLLETYNPNIKALLRRTATVSTADHELLEGVLQDVWTQIVAEENGNAIDFDLDRWRALPLALKRGTLRRAAHRLCPRLRDIGFVHIEQALSIANSGTTGAQATLPHGLHLTVGYQTLQMTDTAETRHPPEWPLLWVDEPISVAIPGQTKLPNGPRPMPTSVDSSSEWWLEACLWHGERESIKKNPDRWTAYLDADRLGPRPTLRKRRSGDQFRPLGMREQEVQIADFMINAKIPRRWREHIPLLTIAQSDGIQGDQVAWIAGWRIDERVKITARTSSVVRLCWRRVPDAASCQV